MYADGHPMCTVYTSERGIMVTVPTPSLHVTADGRQTWKVRYRIHGRATSRTFRETDTITPESAQRAALAFADMLAKLGPEGADRALEHRLAAPTDTPTVAAWCTSHIESLSGTQDDTLGRYRAYVANDLGALAGLPVTAVQPEDVSRWVNAMARGGAAGKTVKNKHGLLSAAMGHAVRVGLIPSNPCEGTRLPRTETAPMVFLTHDEYARFLDYVPPAWQTLVAFLFGSGLRWGEATALRCGDVDLIAGTATVTRAWKRGGALGPPKSRRSRRTVQLAPETTELLRPLVENRPADAWVFTNARGGPVRHQTFHDSVWQPAVRLANGEPARPAGGATKRRDATGAPVAPAKIPLGKRPRIHDCRHTCASWLLGAGVPINYVQAHLGHESITTTVDRYGHVMPAARQAIAGAMSLALASAHPQIEP